MLGAWFHISMKRFTRQSTQRAAPSRSSLHLETKVSNRFYVFAGFMFIFLTNDERLADIPNRGIRLYVLSQKRGGENLIWPMGTMVCYLFSDRERTVGEGETEMEKHMSPFVRSAKVWGRSIDEWLTLRFLSRTIGRATRWAEWLPRWAARPIISAVAH